MMIQKASPSPAKTSSAKKEKTPGQAFKRVDAEIWNKEIIQGLQDNSCKY